MMKLPGFGPPSGRDIVEKKSGAAMLAAAEENDVRTVKAEVSDGVEITYEDNRGHTVLWYAVENNNPSFVQWCLSKGADVNVCHDETGSAMHAAGICGSVEIINILKKAGAKVDAPALGGKTPLHLAIQNGHLDAVQALVGMGANIKALNDADVSALHFAAAEGSKDIINYVLSKGVDINARNQNGKTPLHVAAEKNNIPVIKIVCLGLFLLILVA